jgi:hypothetical protein
MHHGRQKKKNHGSEAARQSLRGEGRRAPELDPKIKEEKSLQILQMGKAKRREKEPKVVQLPLDICRHLRSG